MYPANGINDRLITDATEGRRVVYNLRLSTRSTIDGPVDIAVHVDQPTGIGIDEEYIVVPKRCIGGAG